MEPDQLAFVENLREELANQLLMRGHATMKEVLTVSFGEWPPKGLDVNPDVSHEQTVEIQTTHENISGKASCDEHIIYINKEKCDLWGCGIHVTIGHEGVHLLQFDQGMQAEEAGGNRRELTCNKIMRQILDCDLKNLRGNFNRASQHDQEWVTQYNINSGIEVQARIHVILSEAYQDWQNMPQSRDQLWKALASSGLMPPPEVAEHLEALPVDSDVHHFKHRNGYSPSEKENQAVDELDMVRRTLSESGDVRFWRETLPALYADLIEMYGAHSRRERFGLGVNHSAQAPQQALTLSRKLIPAIRL